MRIGFFVDGDHAIGMGHVYRCLALARELLARRPHSSVVFHTRPDSEAAPALRSAGLGPVAEADHGGGRFNVLVVDRLAMEPGWLDGLRQRCQCLVSLDDTGPGHFVADLAVNSLYRPKVARPAASATESLWGLDYLILDRAFAAARPTPREALANVYLTQGGADTWGLTARLAEALAPWLAAHPEVTLHVKTGPAFADEDALGAALARIPGHWQRHRLIEDLASLAAGMDVAITAAGLTAFELLAAGIPCLLVTDEEKELETAADLAEQGLAISLGRFHDGIGARLAAELERLAPMPVRQEMARRASAAVDGCGAGRIADLILQRLDRPC